jgi:DNA invertase Pin-like site-specific DNA recombinase
MIYDIKYRQRVVDFLKEGHTQNEAKAIFKVGITTIKRWVKQYLEVGHLKNKPLTNLVYVDESGIDEYLFREHGRAVEQA